MFDNSTFSITSFILLALLGLVTYQWASHKMPLPPGPLGKLITGNAHQLPKIDGYRTFAKWAETYGQSPYLTPSFQMVNPSDAD